jgi:hypothetical protein
VREPIATTLPLKKDNGAIKIPVANAAWGALFGLLARAEHQFVPTLSQFGSALWPLAMQRN